MAKAAGTTSTREASVETRSPDEFATVLKQSFKPRSDRAATEVENAVTTLVHQALADTTVIKDDVLDTIEGMIARLDEKLSAQMNEVLHAPEFQQIESAWRGLHYLAFNSETDSNLKIRVINVSKNEIYRNLRLYPGARWDQSPLFKAVYEAEFGQLGVEAFAFEEDTDGHKGEKYAWMNAAYAMAVNVNRAFKEWGWCTRIRGVQSGGEVINLPTHTFPTDDGGVDLKCPTEIAISDRREHELAKSGLIPIIHRKNTDKAAFIGAQSVYKPKKFSGKDGVAATASDNLKARLPYMFAVSRFAHYLKCMVRDKIGSMKEKEALQRWLQEWIYDYVDGDPVNSSEETKCRKPLADARVEVFENEENPGYYSARFYLRPHYQLEGMDIGMSLVSRLPAAPAG